MSSIPSNTDIFKAITATLNDTENALQNMSQKNEKSRINIESANLAVIVAKERIHAPLLVLKLKEMTDEAAYFKAMCDQLYIRFKEISTDFSYWLDRKDMEQKEAADQLTKRDTELTSATKAKERLVALLFETEKKLADSEASKIRYTIPPHIKTKLTALETRVSELEAQLVQAEKKIADSEVPIIKHTLPPHIKTKLAAFEAKLPELETQLTAHKITVSELEQHNYFLTNRQRVMGDELHQSRIALWEQGTQRRLAEQQLADEQSETKRVALELDETKKKLCVSAQVCEGSAECTSCNAHLLSALRISRAYEREAGQQLEAAWVEKMILMEDLAVLKSGLDTPPVTASLVDETDKGRGLHPVDSVSGSRSDTSDIMIVL